MPGRLTWTQKHSLAVPKKTLECLTTFDDVKNWEVGCFYVQTLNSFYCMSSYFLVRKSALWLEKAAHFEALYYLEICPIGYPSEETGSVKEI